MRISKIDIENFRQHRSVSLDLRGPKGSFVILRGLNGAGKTNFLKAVTWAVTGQLGRGEPEYAPASLASFGAITDTPIGQSLTVKVQLEIELSDGKLAELKRVVELQRTGEDRLEMKGGDLRVTSELGDGGWQNEPEPDLWLDRYLPNRFSHYFLFDGEQLEKFFKETEARYVQDAVLEIAQIDHLARMVERLGQVESDITKEAGRLGGAAGEEDLEAKFAELEKSGAGLTKKLADKRLQLESNEAEVSKLRDKAGNIQAIQAEMKRRDTLKNVADAAQEALTEANHNYDSWTTTLAPFVLLGEGMSGLEGEIERARQEKVLPPAYDPDTLRELIESKKCVCGREIGNGDGAHRHIQDLIQEFAALSEVGEALRQLEGPLNQLRGRFGDKKERLAKLAHELKVAGEKARDTMTKYETLRKELAGHDDENISLFSQAFDNAIESGKLLTRDIATLSRDIEEIKKAKEVVQKQIETAGAKDASKKRLFQELDFTKAVLAEAEILFDQLKDEVRGSVAENLNREFQSMIWKKDAFEPVQIDEDYRVRVTNKQGFENREGLSAGETACLAFAFALTLSKVAGFSYPMVVDSPLGRLSGEVKKSVSAVLARYLVSEVDEDSRQLIMLVTDEEFDEGVQEVLKASAPTVMDIVFDQSRNETRLEVVSGV